MDFVTELIIIASSIGGFSLICVIICIVCARRLRHRPQHLENLSSPFEKAIDKANKKKPKPTPTTFELECHYCPVPPEPPTTNVDVPSEPEDPDAIVPLMPNAPFNPTYNSPPGTGLNDLAFVVSSLQANINSLQDEVEELRFSRDLFIKKIAKIEKSIKSLQN